MHTYYVSLIGPFIGYFVKIEAEDRGEVRLRMNADRRMCRLWCSVYTEDEYDESYERYGFSHHVLELFQPGAMNLDTETAVNQSCTDQLRRMYDA